MKQKQDYQIVKLFLISIAVAGILLLTDTFVSNRLSTNVGRIVSSIIFGFFAIPLFILGASKSFKMKLSTWAALNVIAVIVIVGWTLFISVVLYAFKDFQLVIPG